MKAFEGCPGSQILEFKIKDAKASEETIGGRPEGRDFAGRVGLKLAINERFKIKSL